MSAPADSLDDFQLIAAAQGLRGMLAARHDLAIVLDRDPFAGQAELLQQLLDRAVFHAMLRFAVDLDVHELLSKRAIDYRMRGHFSCSGSALNPAGACAKGLKLA